MAFNQTEVIYYVFVFLFGCLGGLGRWLFDKAVVDNRGVVGSVLASGVWSFGAVGIWVGHSPSAVVGPMYFLAVSVFVGYFTDELVSYTKHFFKKIINAILKKVFGIEVEENS